MKRSELVFTVVLIPIDFAMLFLSSLIVYYLRFSSAFVEIRPIQFDLPFSNYFGLVLFIIPFWIVIFALSGLYDIKKQRRLVVDFYRIFLAVSAGMAALIVLIFFRHELFASRFLVIANWAIAIFLVSFGRYLIRVLRRFLFKYDYGVKRAILIGKSQECSGLVSSFYNNPQLGYKVINHFKDIGKEEFKKIDRNLERGKADEIINCDPDLPKNTIVKLIDLVDEYKAEYRYLPDFFEAKAVNTNIGTIAGIPIVSLKRTPLEGWWQVFKRALDIFLATILIIIFSPLFLIIALAIKIDSPGPVIYRNKRIGYKGKVFEALKFRSMKIEYCTGEEYGGEGALQYEKELITRKSERKGPIYKVLDDPRRTRVGKFLEKTSLDELPQFINVIKGNMSLVGPRPHQPREVEKYPKKQRIIFAIKPGLTGLAQISGRSDLDSDEEFNLDFYYMESWSLGLDIQILLKTPFSLFKKRKTS